MIFTKLLSKATSLLRRMSHSQKSKLNSVQNSIFQVVNREEPTFDISEKSSLIEELREKQAAITFCSTVAQEQDSSISSTSFLEQGSIFRKLGSIHQVAGRTKVKERVFSDSFITFTEGALSVYSLSKTDSPEIPLENISLTCELTDRDSLINLNTSSRKVGETYAAFENNVFFRMLTSCPSYHEVSGVDDLAGVFRACKTLRDDGASKLLVILPQTYASISSIFKDEVTQELNLSEDLHFLFIPDLSLFGNGVRAAVIEVGEDLTIFGIQKGSLVSSVIQVETKVVFQSLMKAGYAMSGLTKACICTYNDSESNN